MRCFDGPNIEKEWTIHTSVFVFTMLTTTTDLWNGIEGCLKLEINRNNYPGILKIYHGKVEEMSGNKSK